MISIPISSFYGVKGKNLLRHYRDYLSDFKGWKQRSHAKKWLLYPENLAEHLSIDETSLSHGELYTIVTNKAAKGKKWALQKIPERQRLKVREITLDMAGNMELIAKRFRSAVRGPTGFMFRNWLLKPYRKCKYRWEALDAENEAIDKARNTKTSFKAEILANGDTVKQLLARARYVLYKKPADWTENQKERAELLFERYPSLQQAYNLSMGLSTIFEKTTDKLYGLARLAKWHEKVRQSGFKAFNTISRSIQHHYQNHLKLL
jgi:transposase